MEGCCSCSEGGGNSESGAGCWWWRKAAGSARGWARGMCGWAGEDTQRTQDYPDNQ